MAKKDITIPITRLDDSKTSDIPLPLYMSPDSAGMDMHAAVEDDVILEPGISQLIPTGFAIAIPPGYEGQVRARSSIALKHNVIIPNAPGTIDSDYRGELRVPLLNVGKVDFTVKRGDRVAQLIIAPVVHADWKLVDELPISKRGTGGFGSTGK